MLANFAVVSIEGSMFSPDMRCIVNPPKSKVGTWAHSKSMFSSAC